jgi:hypothetical protein
MRRIRSHRYVKRIYAALMISSLVCQLQVIVVSTVALERLSRAYDKEVSVEAFMRRYFDLEWIAVRLNFFVGVLSFVTAIGLRAWQTIAWALCGNQPVDSTPSAVTATGTTSRRWRGASEI